MPVTIVWYWLYHIYLYQRYNSSCVNSRVYIKCVGIDKYSYRCSKTTWYVKVTDIFWTKTWSICMKNELKVYVHRCVSCSMPKWWWSTKINLDCTKMHHMPSSICHILYISILESIILFRYFQHYNKWIITIFHKKLKINSFVYNCVKRATDCDRYVWNRIGSLDS